MNNIQSFMKYVKEAKIEFDKVIFPTKTEVKQSFISVTIMVTAITLFLSLVDLVMNAVLKAVL